MPRVEQVQKKALEEYISKTNRRITFEYLMIKDVTDTEKDLMALKNYCDSLLCHINLIKWNPTPNSEFNASSNETINQWIKDLNGFHIETTLRESRGADIDAACGQLLNNLNK